MMYFVTASTMCLRIAHEARTQGFVALLLAAAGCGLIGEPGGKRTPPTATMVWSNSLIGSIAQTTIDDSSMYVLHNQHDVYAFAKATGQLRWQKVLPYSPAATLPGFGIAIVASVLVVGDQHAFGLDPSLLLFGKAMAWSSGVFRTQTGSLFRRPWTRPTFIPSESKAYTA